MSFFGVFSLGQSGTVRSRYCRVAAKHCFPQLVLVSFSPTFYATPKVVVGLNLIDTYSHHNVRVHVVVKKVTTSYFTISFQPWDDSITYQVGVYWMACPWKRTNLLNSVLITFNIFSTVVILKVHTCKVFHLFTSL